jgi:mannosyltransferase
MLIIDGVVFSLQRQGGIGVYFQQLLSFLSRQQEATTILIEDPLLQNLEAIDSHVKLLRNDARILERYRYCRVPSNGSVFHSSYYRLPSQRNLPTVVTVHDFIYERFRRGPRQWVHSLQKNSSIRAAQAVICVSESTKQDLLEYVGEIPGQEVYVIHNGVSDIYKSLRLEPPLTPFVLFVGLRSEYKNFRLALEAMEFLPDLELHCVGGGGIQPDELKGISESIAKRVRHLGFVTDEELNALYNRAVCLVYPSSYEGFGIPVLEAMRAGCPVVCTDCKAVVEVGGEALTIAQENDPKMLSEAITKTTSSNRCSIINKGLVVAQKYSWEVTHRQTLAVYRSLGA